MKNFIKRKIIWSTTLFLSFIVFFNISKASSIENYYKLDSDVFGSIGDTVKVDVTRTSGILLLNNQQRQEAENNGYISQYGRERIISVEYGNIFINRFYKGEKFIDTVYLSPTANTGGAEVNFNLKDGKNINIGNADFYEIVGDNPAIGLKDRIDINSFYSSRKKIISSSSYKITSEETSEEIYIFTVQDSFGNLSKYVMKTVGDFIYPKNQSDKEEVTIRYNTRIPNIEVSSETVPFGELATIPEEPNFEELITPTGRYKKYFGGWFYDNRTHSIPMNFSEPIKRDINLHISWCDTLRLNGENRYETSRIVARRFDKSESAIFVNGNSYTDALAGSALANSLNSPLFLIDKNSLHLDDLAVLKYLKVKDAYIVGNEDQVSDIVSNRLKILLGDNAKIKRISGRNQFEVSINVADEILNIDKYMDSVIIANGLDFPDALSATTLSNRFNAPILFAKSDSIDKSVERFIKINNIEDIYIVGGVNSITDDIEEMFPGKNVMRFSGSNRYETSAKIIEYSNFNIHSLLLVSGENFADGIVAGPYAGLLGQAVALAPNTDNPPESLIPYLKKTRVHEVIAVGGEDWLSDELLKNISSINKVNH